MKINKETLQLIEQEVTAGNIEKYINGDLIQYNYSNECSANKHWNPATLMCRGLIVDQAANVVALPFYKFFNYGETQQVLPNFLPADVTEKMDGVFGIGYWWNGKFSFATRWGMTTPKGAVANKIWSEKYPNVVLPEWATLLVEIIHPETKIIVDYDFSDLIVIGVRNRESGEDYDYARLKEFCDRYGLRAVKNYPFSLDETLKRASEMDHNQEGFVLRYQNGLRIKIKSGKYMELARLLAHLSDQEITKQWASGTIYAKLDKLEEFRFLVEEKVNKLQKYHDEELAKVNTIYQNIPKWESRKDFAMFIQKNYDYSILGHLFNMLDHKPVDMKTFILKNKIYKKILDN